jgi:rhamnosyltransferase
MKEIGIVIRTFNEDKYLQMVLDKIGEQREQSYHIVFVDSGSKDRTLEIIESVSDCTLVKMTPSEFTYGRSLNVGIEALPPSCKYVALLSAHAIPTDNMWLEQLIAPLRSDKNIAGVYGKQTPLEEHLTNPIVKRFSKEFYPNAYGKCYFATSKIQLFSNANSAIRIKSWSNMPFDEILPNAEDIKWARQMAVRGSLIAYQPRAAVYHSHPDSYFQFYQRKAKEEAAYHLLGPQEAPKVSMRYLLCQLAEFTGDFIRKTIKYKKPTGEHWDDFIYLVVRNLAVYNGRRNTQR